MRRYLALLLLPALLNGCVSMAVSAGTEVATTAMENRSAGRKVDDKLLYADVYNQFSKADRSDLIAKVNLNTRFGRLMLTGTVKSEADRETAEQLAWKAANLEEVINEIVVNPNKQFYDTANDSLIKRNLEARLLITKDVWVINYSLDIQNNVAYIIGRVKDQAELDRVLNIARTTKGIKRVVSHLQIDPGVQPAPVAPANADVTSKQAPAPIAPAEPKVYVPHAGAIDAPPVPQDSTRRSY